MTTTSLFARWLGVAFAASISASAAQATPMSLRISADDVYVAYVGNSNGTGLVQIGSDGNKADAENYSFNASAGQYLYVLAWNHPGANSLTQALQASVTDGSTTRVTDASHWQAATMGFWNDGAEYGNLPPPLVVAEARTSGATWTSDIVAAAASDPRWGDVHGGGTAQWIWKADFGTAWPNNGLFAFRTALDAGDPGNGSVPEPASLALTLMGLGGAAWLRRRRENNY